MEPEAAHARVIDSAARWKWWVFDWAGRGDGPYPRHLTLDALHEVEARLTGEQRTEYRRQLCLAIWDLAESDGHFKLANVEMTQGQLMDLLIHATAVQKVRALASTLQSQSSSGQ